MCPKGQDTVPPLVFVSSLTLGRAFLAMEGRGNTALKIHRNSRTAISRRRQTRGFSDLKRPLQQKGNGCAEAADQKDNSMLLAVRCPEWREKKGTKKSLWTDKMKIWQGSSLTNDPKMK